jgi:hypothetical protein
MFKCKLVPFKVAVKRVKKSLVWSFVVLFLWGR